MRRPGPYAEIEAEAITRWNAIKPPGTVTGLIAEQIDKVTTQILAGDCDDITDAPEGD